MLPIKQGEAAFSFSEVNHTHEPEGRLLIKVMMVDPSLAFFQYTLNLFDVPV
jgi:hypothetical protein